MKNLLIILFLFLISIEAQPAHSMETPKETVTSDGHSRIVSSSVEHFDPGPDMLSPMTRLQVARSASIEAYYEQQKAKEAASANQRIQDELDLLVVKFLQDQDSEEDPDVAEALRRSMLDTHIFSNDNSTFSSTLPILAASSLPVSSLPQLPSSSLVHTPPCSLLSSPPKAASSVLSANNTNDSPSGVGSVVNEDVDFEIAKQQSLCADNEQRCKALREEIKLIDEQRDTLWKECMQIWEDKKGVDEKYYASLSSDISSTDKISTTPWTREDNEQREKYSKRESEIHTLREQLWEISEKLQKELSERHGY